MLASTPGDSYQIARYCGLRVAAVVGELVSKPGRAAPLQRPLPGAIPISTAVGSADVLRLRERSLLAQSLMDPDDLGQLLTRAPRFRWHQLAFNLPKVVRSKRVPVVLDADSDPTVEADGREGRRVLTSVPEPVPNRRPTSGLARSVQARRPTPDADLHVSRDWRIVAPDSRFGVACLSCSEA